ncbi:hypothetical protein ABW20_dc0100717 [Dactylellina cionopaga]|nr:hypothetical protein ABW20_dc0100717 [Dactylellina cionopaga]
MSLKTLFAYSLVALDVVAALSLRQAEPFEDFGSYVGYSLPEGFYIKRQTLGCPVGLQQCARVGNQIACAAPSAATPDTPVLEQALELVVVL